MRAIILLIFIWKIFSGHAFCTLVVTAGPEIYQFVREREGGTRQHGRVDGFRFTLERIKCRGWYGGIDNFYGKGTLNGKTATGRKLKSHLKDHMLEARAGFTFQQPNISTKPYFTLFGGFGRFKETNDFSKPSPIPCKFTDTFNYFAAGFLSGVNFTPLLSMGINFKLRFMQDAQSKVTNDPSFKDATLKIKEEIHVRVDFPLNYLFCSCRGLGALFSPFFEYRHFGGREGYPFNFRDTKFYLYGARLALTYQF